jgi:ribosome-binding factor A
LKQRNRRSKESQFIDPDFAEALCEGESRSLSSGPQAQRKARQFCRQVQRALNLALTDRSAGDDLDGVFVEEVFPAPDCGRLLVQVIIPDGRAVTDTLNALRRDTPRLRSEVAMAITRKRAPEFSFVPVYLDGGPDGGLDGGGSDE